LGPLKQKPRKLIITLDFLGFPYKIELLMIYSIWKNELQHFYLTALTALKKLKRYAAIISWE